MKTLQLSDTAAQELLTALQNALGSTETLPVGPPPIQTLPTPPPVPAKGPLNLYLDWDNPTTQTSDGFGPDSTLDVQFTTGPLTPARYSRIVMAEFRGGPVPRHGFLLDPDGNVLMELSGTTLTFIFSIGPNTSGFYPALRDNTLYTVRVKNLYGQSGEMYAQLQK